MDRDRITEDEGVMTMERKKIAILFGGCSTEYEVSLQSAAAVIRNIDRQIYEPVLVGITRDGAWYRYDGPVERIQNDTWANHPSCTPAVISPDRQTRGLLIFKYGLVATVPLDAVFAVLHGKNGEDGTIQGLLEIAGIPCVGCGLLSSAICMDKDVAHRLAQGAGIATPPSVVVRSGISEAELLDRVSALTFPLFVKPANAGSSFGISKVTEPSKLFQAVTDALGHDCKVVVEQAVEGFEVGCAVLGNGELTIGEVDEIELSGGFFDYTEKYTLKTAKIHMPARIDPDTSARIKQTAAKVYEALECRGFARVDMFLTPEKQIVFNEVNTIPGFTAHSRYPSMLGGIGVGFAQIVNTLISLALSS